jgi:murein L,D-transpeptidase YcbB/YkuD
MIAGLALGSCQNLVNNEATSADDSASGKAIAIAPRDMSINANNSYTDLFLDSAAVERFIQQEALNDSTARGMRSFYNKRNFQYAWFSSNGLTEQGRGFWNLYDYSISRNMNQQRDAQSKDSAEARVDSLEKRMDTLLNEDTMMVNSSDSSFVKTELALTRHFIELAQRGQDSTINYAMIQTFFPAKKSDLMQYTDSILNKQNEDSAYAGSNPAYLAMKGHLQKYYEAAQKGGWQPLPASTKGLKKGSSSPAVTALKKRLQMTGELGAGDTSAVYSDSLVAAVQSYQQRHGLKPSGIVNDSMIQSLNIPVQDRIEQIVLNMNRMLWSPQLQDSNIIQVNIPDYHLYVHADSGKAMEMPVVVGKQGSSTMMFNGDLNQIVFSPYWNIPESIVRDEIMPKLKADPNYLKKNNMEIVNQRDSIPVIRQLPGPKNSLGQVKFLFPNNYDIYLHDTPDKNLFAMKNRALSHGCIRVQNPEALAQYLLRGQQDWTAERIRQAMNSDKEQVVKLNNPVPVAITYYTAWVDREGKLNFRNDVYQHDDRTAKMMFTNSAQRRDIATTPQGDTAAAVQPRP